MEHLSRPLIESARRHAERIDREASQATPPAGLARWRRMATRVRQAFARKLAEIVQDHWDVGVFDLVFGSLKAFGVYPALYTAGLAWTIPLMEYAPLNTQLWTAGYLGLRGKIASALGRRRYGHPLDRLDALRDESLQLDPRDARHVHRFALNGELRRIRIRHGRLRNWWERRRGVELPRDLWLPGELRRLVGDAEFAFRANALRTNAFLYERVLIEKALASDAGRAALLERSTLDRPLAAAVSDALGGDSRSVRAQLLEQRRALQSALTTRGRVRGLARLALRWLHASHIRAIERRQAVLRDLEYRWLSDAIDSRSATDSPWRNAIRGVRWDLAARVERAGSLAERAARVMDTPAALALLARELRPGIAGDVSARRARVAAGWLESVEHPDSCGWTAALDAVGRVR